MTSVELTARGTQEEVSLAQLDGDDGKETDPRSKVDAAFEELLETERD